MIVILHGWGASSRDNWFMWLKDELEKRGHEVAVPDMPKSQHPKQEEWMETVLPLVDEETVLVGHSLGTVLILRILEKMAVGAAYLVAGFDEGLGIEEISDFFKEPFDYETIKDNADITMLSSTNDPYISLDIANDLARKLDCGHVIFKDKNHLSSGTHEGKFPELLEMIHG